MNQNRTKVFSLRQKAIFFRENGYSYNMIAEILGLSKSTLSDWLSEMHFVPNATVLNRIKGGQMRSAIFKNIQKLNNVESMKSLAKKEIGILSKRDLLFLGIGLYLGEGSKTHEQIVFVNSDPKIIKTIIRWFRDICMLSDENFSPRIFSYPDIDSEDALEYWSSVTGLNRGQFAKIQIDGRLNKSVKNKSKLPHGTLHLRVKSNGDPNFGRSLHRRIMGWLESSLNQI